MSTSRTLGPLLSTLTVSTQFTIPELKACVETLLWTLRRGGPLLNWAYGSWIWLPAQALCAKLAAAFNTEHIAVGTLLEKLRAEDPPSELAAELAEAGELEKAWEELAPEVQRPVLPSHPRLQKSESHSPKRTISVTSCQIRTLRVPARFKGSDT